jgi:3-dehydroquinate synthase
MASDKKRESDRLRFVLLKKIGQAYVTDDVTVSDVDAAWAFALGRT